MSEPIEPRRRGRFAWLRSPVTAAMIMSAALVAWIGSGWIAPSAQPPSDPAGAQAPVNAVTSVRVVESAARPTSIEYVLAGRTEPSRRVVLRAEISGQVTEIARPKGSRVASGEAIVRLDRRDLETRLRQAEAWLAQREIASEASERLGERGFEGRVRVAEANAQLAEARAAVDSARLALEDSTIVAPFAGVVDHLPVELGSFLDRGDEIATLVEEDPFLIVADAPEAIVGYLRPGLTAQADLADGRTVEGTIRFVAAEGAAETRTYRVEVEVANPGGTLLAQMTARLRLVSPPIPAHAVTAAALVLDDAGQLGVKTVDEAGRVRFVPSRIVKTEDDIVHLVGPGPSARIIVVGQGFVSDGQTVEVVAVPPDGSAS